MISVPYTLRYSKKAKYLQLRMSRKGLEVVVPVKKKLSEHYIHTFIRQKNDWILRAQQRYAFLEQSPCQVVLPTQIELLAINQRWEVNYIPTERPSVSLHSNAARQIKLMGNVTQPSRCFALLKRWLKQMAEHHLCDMLRQAAEETGISFHQAAIRNNTTRWGSCTSQKKISLCCRLLFLPPQLVKHVLLHELCHIKHMNHSKSFWRLLETLDPHTPRHRVELKKSAQCVPAWVYA